LASMTQSVPHALVVFVYLGGALGDWQSSMARSLIDDA
jgi:hypothetical protein